jgi:hypothetical protein
MTIQVPLFNMLYLPLCLQQCAVAYNRLKAVILSFPFL